MSIEGTTLYCGDNCNHTGPHRYPPPQIPPTGFWMWPTDKDGNTLVGYWTCRCGTIVPPAIEHRCPLLRASAPETDVTP